MFRNSVVAALAIAAVTVPAFADVPDGRGGRTAPWKLSRPDAVAAPAHACCGAIAALTERTVSSPAELKALGHVAWVSRKDDPSGVSPCYKQVVYRPATYASPAELKALGHVAARDSSAAPSVTRTCCQTGRCPMRARATASR